MVMCVGLVSGYVSCLLLVGYCEQVWMSVGLLLFVDDTVISGVKYVKELVPVLKALKTLTQLRTLDLRGEQSWSCMAG